MNPPPEILEGIRQALEKDPSNGALWAHYGQLLLTTDRRQDTIDALRNAVDLDAGGDDALVALVRCLREAGRTAEAVIRIEKSLTGASDPRLRIEHAWTLALRDETAEAIAAYRDTVAANDGLRDPALEAHLGLTGEPAHEMRPTEREAPELHAATTSPDEGDAEAIADRLTWGDIFTTFKDVAGLEDVKDQIRLRIIAPYKNENIYEAFGRAAGGGLLLYGPPGCGKTFIARATAGEVGARFVSIGISEVMDRWMGESEKVIHAIFDQARANAPTVLFFDEFDALGGSRGVGDNQFFRTMVDQLLQEMDGVAGGNVGVLVFAATNLPWHVDPAFRRPGRFDRVIFVPPPDEPARRKILADRLKKLPGADAIDVPRLVERTSLFTGADLEALCERASERALSASLRGNEVVPVTLDDFERGLEAMRSTAEEWIATARNHAKYSNQGGRYDDVIRYLKSIKRW